MTHVFDTGGPQGPPPTSSSGESGEGGGAGAGLDLDRLALISGDIVRYESAHSQLSVQLAEDVLALVERVRVLEAVAEAAREIGDYRISGPYWFGEERWDKFTDALDALAAAGGGDPHE